jgi:hypothetical protein
MIALEITDSLTDKVTIVRQTPHDAKKLYLALRELFGDAQYQAQPGELVTVPNVNIRV